MRRAGSEDPWLCVSSFCWICPYRKRNCELKLESVNSGFYEFADTSSGSAKPCECPPWVSSSPSAFYHPSGWYRLQSGRWFSRERRLFVKLKVNSRNVSAVTPSVCSHQKRSLVQLPGQRLLPARSSHSNTIHTPPNRLNMGANRAVPTHSFGKTDCRSVFEHQLEILTILLE